MVDIHCHILPSLDDGAQDEAVSLAMARMAAEDGITHVVATPHSNYQFAFDAETNRRKRDALQEAVGKTPAILLGCDFHLSYENLEAVRLYPSRYTVNGSQYLLVEFADTALPPSIDSVFSDLLSRNLIPIITHPERNPILARDLNQIQKWIATGCFVQVTAASFTGRFGRQALKASLFLLRHNMIHFIASDAHDTIYRPLRLSEARRMIAKSQGQEVADAVSEANPRAVIEGRNLPWQPEALPIQDRKWFSFRH